MSREVPCPNCGGPIEFKMGSANALACPWCRACVMRTDRDLQNLGKLADLVPTATEFNVGDTAILMGNEVVIGGRMQLDHGAGPWDEWYVENTRTRQWAWLAKAQGRWYYTTAINYGEGTVPTWQQMAPGQAGQLPGVQGSWTVGERGHSQLVSAEGELPYPFRPGERSKYVDLSNAEGGFATIDYGDGSEAPRLFVGRKLQPDEFKKGSGAGLAGPMATKSAANKIEAKRLRCPTCGDAVPVFAPQATERVVCGSCNSLLDYQNGDLSMLRQLEQARTRSPIPLGTEGTIAGEKVIVIGYMERITRVDYVTYRWREFLMHVEGHGFWWLLEDNGHFQLIRPVEVGEIEGNQYSRTRSYKGQKFTLFSRIDATVDLVVGEFYWKVEKDSTARLEDFIDPPRVISSEMTPNELSWSVGEHIEGTEVWSGLGLEGKPPHKRGVGVVQPNPHKMKLMLIPAAALVLLFVLFGMTSSTSLLVEGPVGMSPVAQAAPNPSGAYAMLTPPFAVNGPASIEVELSGNPNNQFMGASCALINEDTREVHDLNVDFGYYQGIDQGYAWNEGSTSGSASVHGVAAGTYRLRIDPFWQPFPQPGGPAGLSPPTLSVRVTASSGSAACCFLSFFLLFFPILFRLFRRTSFETRRKENGNV